MSDESRSLGVLKKILKKKPVVTSTKSEEVSNQMVNAFWDEEISPIKISRGRPGRPKIKEENKAKNITLCLAQKYLKFLDDFNPPKTKLMGRGRKVRYIIDEFVVLYKRQRTHLDLLNEMLIQVESILKKYSFGVKKGEKLQLSPSERREISKQVQHVTTFLKMFAYSPKELQKLLSREKWSVLAFCLDWRKQHGE
jgi:hypothetical protein